MRKANVTVWALVAVCLLVVALVWGRGGYWFKENPEEQIKKLQEQGRQAALKGDSAFVEKHFADDYVGVGGNGQMRTKAEVVQMYKSGAIKYESIDERSVKIRTYWDTTVVNTEAAVKLTLDGKPISGDFRAVFVWVKPKGNWKLVAFQSTPVV